MSLWTTTKPIHDGWYWFQDAECLADPVPVRVSGEFVEAIGVMAWVPLSDFRESCQWMPMAAPARAGKVVA